MTNGQVLLRNSILQANQANESGGALQVDGGEVTLASGTELLDNDAPVGAAISFVAGSLSYELPAPLGRWVFAEWSSRGWLATLNPGDVDSDYPYVCSPGLMGSSFEAHHQSGPQCEGPCLAGFYCPAGTVDPLSWCVARASPSGRCPRSLHACSVR